LSYCRTRIMLHYCIKEKYNILDQQAAHMNQKIHICTNFYEDYKMARYSKIVFLLCIFAIQSNIDAATSNHEDMQYTLQAFIIKNNKNSTKITEQKFPVIRDEWGKNDCLYCSIQNETFVSSYKITDIEYPKENNTNKMYKISISYKAGEHEGDRVTIFANIRENQPFYVKSQFSNGDCLKYCFSNKFVYERAGIYPIIGIHLYGNKYGNNGISHLSEDQMGQILWSQIFTFQNFVRLCGFIGLIGFCSYKITKSIMHTVNEIKKT
jgi:hypothetical protein